MVGVCELYYCYYWWGGSDCDLIEGVGGLFVCIFFFFIER